MLPPSFSPAQGIPIQSHIRWKRVPWLWHPTKGPENCRVELLLKTVGSGGPCLLVTRILGRTNIATRDDVHEGQSIEYSVYDQDET